MEGRKHPALAGPFPLAEIIILISSKSYIAPREDERQIPIVRLLCVREMQALNKICLGQEQ
jgi:hypothetical protein